MFFSRGEARMETSETMYKFHSMLFIADVSRTPTRIFICLRSLHLYRIFVWLITSLAAYYTDILDA